MLQPRFFLSAVASLLLPLLACLPVQAASESTAAGEQAPVISVSTDFSALSAELCTDQRVLDFAANSEQLCREYFIAVQQLLFPHDPLPEKLETRLRFIHEEDGIAWAGGGEITANLKWFLDKPDDVGAIYHELVHIVQAYPHNADAGWLVEGIADWCRYFVYEGRTLESYAASSPGHYRDAYTNAARFLEWLRLNRNPDVVTELNARLRAGAYNAATDWTELCGAGLDSLWEDYSGSAG